MKHIPLLILIINNNMNILMVLMKDKFGNFIISTLLEILEGEKLVILMTKLEKNKDALKKFKYGRFILANLERKQRQIKRKARQIAEGMEAGNTSGSKSVPASSASKNA